MEAVPTSPHLRARAALRLMDNVLELVPEQNADDALDAWADERLAARAAARARGDFAAVDAIRDELLARGIATEDSTSVRASVVSKALAPGSTAFFSIVRL